MGIMLGATIYIRPKFDARLACKLIDDNKIEVVTLVPLMLSRMLAFDHNSFASLKCIISGGAALGSNLVQEANHVCGEILFNMYGTSEAGFCIMATPEKLAKKPKSIGQPVYGVKIKITDSNNQLVIKGNIGRLLIKNAWSISREEWIETGDLAYQDREGDVFLCGRIDDMIISGGENVYPVDLENILLNHPAIESAAVIGIDDNEFGQRLKAVIKLKKAAILDKTSLVNWLKPRIARFQMPAMINFTDELPYTSLGKINKKSL